LPALINDLIKVKRQIPQVSMRVLFAYRRLGLWSTAICLYTETVTSSVHLSKRVRQVR